MHAAARGSLLVSCWLSHIWNLRLPHWSWVLPSASYKLLKNTTSLLFFTRWTRSPPSRSVPNSRMPKLTHLGRVTVLPTHSFSYTRTSILAALKCRSTAEQGPPPSGARTSNKEVLGHLHPERPARKDDIGVAGHSHSSASTAETKPWHNWRPWVGADFWNSALLCWSPSSARKHTCMP